MNALDAALSPFERSSEIIFGLLMAISVTAAFELTAGKTVDVRELTIAALGCNLAWGLIDGVIYLMQQQFERHRTHGRILQMRSETSEDRFRARVRDAVPPVIGRALTPESYAHVRDAVQAYSVPRPRLWPAQEFAVAGIICLLAFGSTFPLVVPFLVMQDVWLALRVSHAVAVVMLFVLGWKLGRWSGVSPLGSGFALAGMGSALAVMCVALGG